jgi:peptidoglycan hydrolase CwlO-like protein
MTEYISVRAALIRDIKSAEAALGGANEAYAEAETDLRRAQGRAERLYDGRAANQRNVDRLKKALSIIEAGNDE